jgi:hypothetical protein
MGKKVEKGLCWELDDSECDINAPSPHFTDDSSERENDYLYGTFPVLIPKRPPSRLQPPKEPKE